MLFPYARAHVREYLDRHATDPVSQLMSPRCAPSTRPNQETRQIFRTGIPHDVRSAEAYVYWLMDRDRKSTGLKSLQGRIWDEGYHQGELQGKAEVYADVRPTPSCGGAGMDSSSRSSPRAAFRRSAISSPTRPPATFRRFCTDYFDTTTGAKREVKSYRLIATALHQDPRDVLFISDVTAELDAAREAGMRTALCVRGATARGDAGGHTRIRSFDELV